uniref:Uncharacterized protein n=1 Tax=Anguilla anguilla TaxID=7936 RepID=A0A0E9PCG3_ANGAN
MDCISILHKPFIFHQSTRRYDHNTIENKSRCLQSKHWF